MDGCLLLLNLAQSEHSLEEHIDYVLRYCIHRKSRGLNLVLNIRKLYLLYLDPDFQ